MVTLPPWVQAPCPLISMLGVGVPQMTGETYAGSAMRFMSLGLVLHDKARTAEKSIHWPESKLAVETPRPITWLLVLCPEPFAEKLR
ncbi:unnamed protein product [Clonostachys rosea]|uniref:Uncharacterized protein n=1 Tax=Bionectria ochroleuca TaxID=29856 RepID=A0ABY6UTR4_BIOOC|nr:unnamed protein product [Clonostachys rosea]